MSDPATVDLELDDPNTRLEIVRAAWREVLGIGDVADDVSFFDAGGDSLRLVILVERLNQTTGRALRTIDLFRTGTIRGQAELLAGPAAATPARSAPGGSDRLVEAARLRAAGSARPGR